MWESIKKLILSLFGKKANKTNGEAEAHFADVATYEDTNKPNFVSIIANRLSTLTVTESNISVTGDNKRAEMLDGLMAAAWLDAQEITARSFGAGGVALVPYVAGGKIYTDIVQKDRFFITKSQGTDILEVTIIADEIIRDHKRYRRFIDYSLDGGIYRISSRATCETREIPLDTLREWENIQPEISIAGVDRLLLAYLRQPYTKGRTDNLYGVPITRGSEWIIAEIVECLGQVKKEFKKKDAKIFADDTLFGKDEKIDAELFKKFTSGGKLTDKGAIDVFDPAFRDTSYYNRLLNLFSLLEKSVGTSKGILTEPQSISATATEIKRGSYDTYALITSMRRQWEAAAEDLVYSFDVLCNAFNLSPAGDYELKFDWSQALVESSAETWQQFKDAQAIGIVKKAELRRKIYTNETMDEAQAVIDEITATEPSLSTLMGVGDV